MDMTYQQKFVKEATAKELEAPVAELLVKAYLTYEQMENYEVILQKYYGEDMPLKDITTLISKSATYASTVIRKTLHRFRWFIRGYEGAYTVEDVYKTYAPLLNQDVTTLIHEEKVTRALIRAGVHTLKELQDLSLYNLRHLPGIGDLSGQEVERLMRRNGMPLSQESFLYMSLGTWHYVITEALTSDIPYLEWCSQMGIPRYLMAKWLRELESQGFVFPNVDPDRLCIARSDIEWGKVFI